MIHVPTTNRPEEVTEMKVQRTHKELLHAIVPHIRELGFEYDRVSSDGKDALDAITDLLNGEG